MYVLSGSLKGRPIKTPKGQTTRPTISKVKKSLFDICMHEVPDCHFLDLFAGSGQMGIEAISRGAQFAHFVEHDKTALSALQFNLKNLEIAQKTRVFGFSATKALAKCIKEKLCFDLIYMDPPYASSAGIEALKIIDQSPLFHPKTRIFLEESAKFRPIELQNLAWIDERNYGSTRLFELSKHSAH